VEEQHYLSVNKFRHCFCWISS